MALRKDKPSLEQLIINEAALLSFLNSENLINVVEIFKYKSRIWMFMEYMDYASQEKIILKDKKSRQYSEQFCQWTLYQVALGIHSMHSQDVLHRDIKSDNILSNSNGEVKIADLGFSAFLTDDQQQRKTKRGTLNWISPEIHRGEVYSKEIDVWSYGCYAFELATGQPPFCRLDGEELVHAVINTHHGQIDDQRWSSDFQDFIDKCLMKNKDERFTIK